MYKLLIVDDEPLIRKGIKTLVDFNELQIESVLEAANGREALEICTHEKPDLILADINMPQMNGLSFAKEVRKMDFDARIAFITGYDYFDYAVQALKIGVDDYILKPVSKKDVTEVLKKLIAKLEENTKQQAINQAVNTLLDQSDVEVDSNQAMIQAILDQEIGNPDFSLTMLSEKLGYSSGHLSGLFKNMYGVAFQDYLLEQRLEKAKILLLTTQMKNYEIAEAVGFSDVNYFGTRFKKRFGESPKQYKEKVGAK